MVPSPDSQNPSPRGHSRKPRPEDPPVQFLRGVGPGRARLLRGLGVETPEALLHYYPRAHEDRRRITPVGELAEGEIAVVRGRVARVLLQRIPGRRSRRPLSVVRVVVADGTGAFEAEWWNQPYRKDHFREGDDVVLSGKVVRRRGLRMSSPEVEILGRAGASGEPGEGVAGEEGDGDSFARVIETYLGAQKAR